MKHERKWPNGNFFRFLPVSLHFTNNFFIVAQELLINFVQTMQKYNDKNVNQRKRAWYNNTDKYYIVSWQF